MESSVPLQQSYRRSQVHLSLEIDHLTRRRWRTTMKKFLLATVGLVALGVAAPASAADLAARPYTKAPPPVIAPIYDWSGFYIGGNGGWGQSRNCVDFFNATGIDFADGCRERSGGLVGGQLGYRWQFNQFVV